MVRSRIRFLGGVALAGLAGVALTGAIRAAANPGPGPGDPPVIILPSARAAFKQVQLQQAQATQVPAAAPAAPKIEYLPPPTPVPTDVSKQTAPVAPIAPPLLPPTESTLRTAPTAPTLTPKDVAGPAPMKVEREVAPMPRSEAVAAKPVERLPAPTGPIPSALAPPGESAMPIRTAPAAAALAALVAAPAPAIENKPAPTPVIEKITDYAKTTDVTALKGELVSLRTQLNTLTVLNSANAKSAETYAVRQEIASLRKDISLINAQGGEPAKAEDVKALKTEIESLRKEIAALNAKPVKDEVDALRKDVQALSTLLREALDGKTDAKGFSHDGLVKRLQKLDESLDALSKKVASMESNTRTAGASPLIKNVETAVARGIVRIVNDYPIEISIVVNGVGHRLEPNARKDIFVPTGTFKYQLLTSGGAETDRAIKENETVTLTIR